jgi:putative ABC transport system substrate-binding protein
VTGISALAADSTPKRLQLLHDLVPHAKSFGLIFNPNNLPASSSTGRTFLELAQDTVGVWGGTVEIAHARTLHELDAAFAQLAYERVEAIATSPDAMFNSGRERVVALAAQHAIPTVYGQREAAYAGGLMSYNADFRDIFRHTGLYAGRILKGQKPADLPVMLPTKFEFIINLKTAKTLGLTIPPGLLAIVDEVIE